jgi:probable HAF family extracellular repeat protein
MRMMTTAGRVAGLLALAPLMAVMHLAPAGAAAPARSAAADLEITDLGTLAGGCCSFAEAINNRGEVVGTSDVGDTIAHAFLWRAGVMTDLGTLGGLSSVGQDVNARGEVVGYSNPAPDSFDLHAFRWRDGRMTDLGTLGGPDSFATGINARGDVVGYSTTATGDVHAFRWRDGTMTDLGGGTTTLAFGVNDRGVIAGGADGLPALWRHGVAAPLALPAGADFGAADAVNNRGHAVGFSGFPSGFSINQATLWRDGAAVDLGTLGGPNSHALGINKRGQVVGVADAPERSEAFLWERGVMTGLGSLAGVGGSQASDVNDRGEIVGSSPNAEGLSHAVIWR